MTRRTAEGSQPCDVHDARLDELERRVTVHDEKLDTLTERVSDFVGQAKGMNKLLGIIVGVSTIIQVVLQFLLHHK